MSLRLRLTPDTEPISILRDRQPCATCLDLDPVKSSTLNLLLKGNKFCYEVEPASLLGNREGSRHRLHAKNDLRLRTSLHEIKKSSESGCAICALLLRASQFYPSGMEGIIFFNLQNFSDTVTDRTRSFVERGNFSFSTFSLSPAFKSMQIGESIRDGYISPSAGAKEGIDFIKKTLNYYVAEHKECQKQGYALPTRLLFLGSKLKPMRIVEPGQKDPIQYAALSYCWGNSDTLRLTKSNETALKTRIVLD